jgi:hypothetical protein
MEELCECLAVLHAFAHLSCLFCISHVGNMQDHEDPKLRTLTMFFPTSCEKFEEVEHLPEARVWMQSTSGICPIDHHHQTLKLVVQKALWHTVLIVMQID